MAYVVYEKESTRRIDGINGGPDKSSFETEGAAKAARTRFLKKQAVYTADDILIAESTKFYAEIEKMITHKGIIPGTGQYAETPLKANTPWCCNPHSETYWSM
jgi:hypothetical protein